MTTARLETTSDSTNNTRAKKLGITRFALIEEVNMTITEAIVSTREASKAQQHMTTARPENIIDSKTSIRETFLSKEARP